MSLPYLRPPSASAAAAPLPRCPAAHYVSPVNLTHAIVAAGLTLSLAGCGGEPDLAAGNLPAVGRGPALTTVLRVPREGGTARLYRVPSLEPSAWKLEDKLPPLQRTVGADPEQGFVFLLDKKRNVVALDLETRRVRPSLEQVRHATVGPDGALYAVDTGRTVTQLVRRTPVRFRSKLQGSPRELHGTMGGMLVARLAGEKPRWRCSAPTGPRHRSRCRWPAGAELLGRSGRDRRRQRGRDLRDRGRQRR